MEKNKRGRRHHNWNDSKNQNSKGRNSNSNNQNFDSLSRSQGSKFRYVARENAELQQKKEKAIKELKEREIICPKCGERIVDVASAFADKSTGQPVHFECVMKQVESSETIGQNEKISYIGQGRFAILYYENIRDQRHFQIKKIIDIEDRDKRAEWRDEMSSLFSQVE